MAGDTSLARQLQKLQAPATSAFRGQKFKPSFLYDSKVAKTIDVDAHYSVALSGLEALLAVDDCVKKYKANLFHESSKELERGLLSEEENAKINEDIKSFLFEVVSQYLLFTGTHKMVEWLVVKYHIQEYNYDELILAVLPYHETKLFARVVQLVPSATLKNSDWHWLKAVQKSGIQFPKQELIKHIHSRLPIIEKVIEMVFYERDQVSTTLVSFVTSCIVNIINSDPSEDIVTLIAQYLHKAFASPHKQVVLSGYLLLGVLACTMRLADNLVKRLLRKMSSCFLKCGFKDLIENDYFLCISLVCETQEVEALPAEAISSCNRRALNMMQHRPKKYITAIIVALINEYEEKEKLNLLDFILVNVTEEVLDMSKLLEAIIQKSKQDRGNQLSRILNGLERRFPSAFDIALKSVDFLDIKELLVSSTYIEVNNSLINISSALSHQNPEIKLSAIVHLDGSDVEITDEINNLLKEAVFSILTNTDIDPAILLSLFRCKCVSNILKSDRRYVKACTTLIVRAGKIFNANRVWKNVAITAAAFIVNFNYENNEDLIEFVTPILFPPISKSELYCEVLNSVSASITLNKFFACLKAVESKDIVNTVVMRCAAVADYCLAENNWKIITIMKTSNEFAHKIYCCIVLHYLCSKSGKERKDELFRDTLEILQNLINNSKASHPQKASQAIEDIFQSQMTMKENRISTLFVKSILENLIKEHTFNTDVNNEWYWHHCNPLESPEHTLFNFICDNAHKGDFSSVFQELLRIFTSKLKTENAVSFLSSYWVLRNKLLKFQARSLTIRDTLSDCPMTSMVETLSLLIAMTSSSQCIRNLAGSVLDRFATRENLLEVFKPFTKELVDDVKSITSILSNRNQDPRNRELYTLVQRMTMDISNFAVPEHVRCSFVHLLADCSHNELVIATVPFLKQLLQLPHLDPLQAEVTKIMVKKVVHVIRTSKKDLQIFLEVLELVLKSNYRKPCLTLLNPKWFASAHETLQATLINSLLDLFITTQDYVFETQLKDLVKDGAMVSELIDRLTKVSTESSTGSAKKLRVLKRIEFSTQENVWKKVFLLLEIILARDDITKPTILMRTCLDLLKETYVDEKSCLDYLRRLLLSIIRSCLLQADCNRKALDVQCIVESFRFARQKETKREALMVISLVARDFREEILDKVMLIFGYIGRNFVNCDDQYTLTVIDDALNEIIPAIVQDNEQVEEDVVDVFIDSIADIPGHRRLHIFRKLTELLSENRSLWFVLTKMCKRSVSVSKKEQKELLEFCKQLVSSYGLNIQLSSSYKLLTIALELEGGACATLGDLTGFTESDRRELVGLHVTLVLHVVSDERFKHMLLNTSWSDVKLWFGELMSTLLIFIDYVSENEIKTKKDSYFKAINRLLQTILEKVNASLPLSKILSTVRSLLKTTNIGVQRKALEIINIKLTSENVNEMKLSKLTKLLKPLHNILSSVNKEKNDGTVINAQIAMFSVKLLAKKLSDQETTTDILDKTLIIVKDLLRSSEKYPDSFIASGILCISQILSCIGTKAIPHIPTFMPFVISYMSKQSQIVLLSCVTAFAKITKNFCQFLSTYLPNIIILSSKARCLLMEDSTANAKLKVIKKNLSTIVPMRTLVTVLCEAYKALSSEKPEAILYLLSIFNDGLLASETAELESVVKEIQQFFFATLDYRSIAPNAVAVDNVEDSVIQCLLVFIPKLSELTFRPFFYNLYDWAVHPTGVSSEHRIVTFYRITNQLADRIRSLFCLFAAPYIVANCIVQLQHYNTLQTKNFTSEEVAHSIVTNVLLTLSKSFHYDVDKTFTSPEKVEKLLPALIDQINNELGSIEMQNYRIRQCVAKCLQNIARSVEDTHVVKDLHYKLLLKFQEESPTVKYNALEIYRQLVLSLGSDYLSLVPEAVTFLAELEEDDNADIQRLLATVFKDLEEVTGESIKKYF